MIRAGLALSMAALGVVASPGTGCRRAPADSGAASGCGREIQPAELWVEQTAAEIDARLAAAMACGRARGTRVLLEFVAPWCEDCQLMTRLEQTPQVAAVLRERYERVRINIGEWSPASEALRARYQIQRIAAYVVLDPVTGRRLAQTTAEPVTAGTPMSPAIWADWLRAPR